MRESSLVVEVNYPVLQVFQVMTNNEVYHWRSDLDHIEIVDDIHFVEYTKQGYKTKFTITKKEENCIYEFDMENKQFSGHWIGKLEAVSQHITKLSLQEKLYIKNPWMEVLSYLAMPLKKIQKQYVADLQKRLEEIKEE